MTADGYQFIEGRSRETSLLLLKLADEQGLGAEAVRTVRNGYEVPTSIAEAFIAEPDREVEDVYASQAFTPVQTNHVPLTFDTVHEEFGGVDVGVDSSDADNVDEAAAGSQPDPLAGSDQVPPAGSTGETETASTTGGNAEVSSESLETSSTAGQTDDESGDDEGGETPENPVPAKSQPKADWLDYARSKGYTGGDDDQTKDQLIATYGE